MNPHPVHKCKWNILDMQVLAAKKGGRCLSPKYINSVTKLLWECKEGHQWSAVPYSIKDGWWCPKCGTQRMILKKRATHSIEEAKILASKKGGKCLSSEYFGVDKKLKWECKKGHQWMATFSNVKTKSWCKICSCHSGKNEHFCRECFEKLLNKSFPKVRPEWLRINRKSCLELDGYCEELKLAFEYQGAQHYKEVNFFQRSADDFTKRQIYDEFKRRECQNRGIRLIEIPYSIQSKYIYSFIKRKVIA